MYFSYDFPLERLRAVPIQENGEPLVDPQALSPRIQFAVRHPKFDMSRDPRVRKRVAEMLAEAAEGMPEGMGLLIVEGFRPLRQQRFIYESFLQEYREKHPEWDEERLTHETNEMSAPPDDSSPPPHSTGAAVDLILFDLTTGEQRDMTSPWPWDDESAPTAKEGLSEAAQRNREILVTALTGVGLVNYPGEWWHWSYGDQRWALQVGAPCALYDRLPEAG